LLLWPPHQNQLAAAIGEDHTPAVVVELDYWLPSTPCQLANARHAVAGFVLAQLRRLPAVSEQVEVSGWRFEVVDLDGRRIDKVLATRVPVTRRQLRT
jgi:CBS domain containing-hemolysin-like protein